MDGGQGYRQGVLWRKSNQRHTGGAESENRRQVSLAGVQHQLLGGGSAGSGIGFCPGCLPC